MRISAIRGATTIDSDSSESVKKETVRLYQNILAQNRLKPKDLICIFAGSTPDIKSYYPATALRLSGLTAAPLFSTLEPEIDGSMPLCIRLLILAKCKKVKHIYLNNAENLIKNN